MNRLENQQAAEPIDGIYQDLEELLMQNIARHIRNYDQPIPTDEWLLQKLAEIGRLDQENIRIISQMAGISNTAVHRMLEEMAEKAIAGLDPAFQYLSRQALIHPIVPVGKSRNIKQVMKAIKNQARDTQNLCNTTMLYKARDAYKALVTDMAKEAVEIAGKQAFLEILNESAASSMIGAESRARALRRCIRRFVEKGIPAFVDSRGREWTPEAYINMAMRTTSAKIANDTQMARCDDHDINLLEVSSHAGARPKCARDQGKIFDRANKSTKYPHWNASSYGEPDGLFGINCGHHGYPYIEGVSIRRYFPTEDLDANDKLYKEIQKQRALERAVRKQKRECMLYDQLGDKEAFEEASVKLKAKEAELKTYVDKNGSLHRRKDREQVAGFDKRISAEAVSSNKNHQKRLEEKRKTDIIKSEIKTIGIRGEVALYPEKIDVSEFSFDDAHINGEREHRVTREEAERFIQEADVSLTRWNGRFLNYYGQNGAVYIDTQEKNVRTAFHKEQYDEKVIKLREVMDRRDK